MVPGLAVRASPTTVILDAALVQSALLLSLAIQLCHGVSVTQAGTVHAARAREPDLAGSAWLRSGSPPPPPRSPPVSTTGTPPAHRAAAARAELPPQLH